MHFQKQLHKVVYNCGTVAALSPLKNITRRIGTEHVIRDHTYLLTHSDAWLFTWFRVLGQFFWSTGLNWCQHYRKTEVELWSRANSHLLHAGFPYNWSLSVGCGLTDWVCQYVLNCAMPAVWDRLICVMPWNIKFLYALAEMFCQCAVTCFFLFLTPFQLLHSSRVTTVN